MAQFNAQTSAEEICDTFVSHIKDKTFLITGTSARGLGAKSASVLANYAPAQLILVSRSKAKVEPVINEINSANPSVLVKFVSCDLADQDSVRQAAETILTDNAITKIDAVINNAGVMALQERLVDKHGNEMHLSSNHIGHFLLTNLLMPKILAAGKDARIVNLSSHGHRLGQFRFDNPTFGNGEEYNPWSAYGQSKTANVLFSVELARRLKDRGVSSYSVDPGFVMSTGLADHLDFMTEVPKLLATAEKVNPGVSWSLDGKAKTDSQGCASALFAALSPELKEYSGAYIDDCHISEAIGYATDLENAKKLWAYSEEVVGQQFDL